MASSVAVQKSLWDDVLRATPSNGRVVGHESRSSSDEVDQFIWELLYLLGMLSVKIGLQALLVERSGPSTATPFSEIPRRAGRSADCFRVAYDLAVDSNDLQ